jgi:hypothetical protein
MFGSAMRRRYVVDRVLDTAGESNNHRVIGVTNQYVSFAGATVACQYVAGGANH